MTVADIAMWRLLGWFKGGVLDGLPTDLIDKYSLLSKFWNDMDANPDIKAYMEAKYPPKSEYPPFIVKPQHGYEPHHKPHPPKYIPKEPVYH